MSDLEKQELQQKILELEQDIRKLQQNLNKDNYTLSAMEVKLQALKYIAWDRQFKRKSSSMYKVLKGEKDYTRDWGEGSRLLTAHSETGRGERGQLRQEFNDRYKEIRKEQESNITQTTQQPSVDGDIDTNTSPRGPRR